MGTRTRCVVVRPLCVTSTAKAPFPEAVTAIWSMPPRKHAPTGPDKEQPPKTGPYPIVDKCGKR